MGASVVRSGDTQHDQLTGAVRGGAHCLSRRLGVLDRRFEAPAPNRKWVADFTYIWTGEGWLYVAAVLDEAYYSTTR